MEAKNLLIMDSSPLGLAGESTRKIMYSVVLSLLPALGVSFWMFGWAAVRVVVLTSLFCIALE
ncbi:MAG TPA: electron transporter RnfD, partial [Caldithrix abyssi]|nr:electron transporter RnfD [Caldithrix abyssi]